MTVSKTDDGGPAFPNVQGHFVGQDWMGGMSLRDYFAAHALNGLLAALASQQANVMADSIFRAAGVRSDRGLAASAYVMADAMLAARGEKAEATP